MRDGPDRGRRAPDTARRSSEHASGYPRSAAPRLAALALVASTAGIAAAPPREAPCGTPEQRFIAALAGDWEGTSRVRVAPGRYAEGEGTVVSAVALGGCGLVTTQEMTVGGSIRSEVHVLAADEEGRFELSAVDSEHGAFTVSAGRLDGDRLVLEWSRRLGERELRTRKVYSILSGGEYRVEHTLSRSPDDPWSATFQASFRRR